MGYQAFDPYNHLWWGQGLVLQLRILLSGAQDVLVDLSQHVLIYMDIPWEWRHGNVETWGDFLVGWLMMVDVMENPFF